MIEVQRPGQFTTIQDLGRFGYRSLGVPVSGPMDSESAVYANKLLGNDPNSPLVEMAFVGATFLFHKSALIAMAGAECELKLNDKIIDKQSVLRVEAGGTLSFGAMKEGNFLYLAIAGGFKVDRVLGSTCYFEAVNGHSRMNKGTILRFDESMQSTSINRTPQIEKSHTSSTTIQVEKGPEFYLLSENERSELLSAKFSISPRSNRMGFMLNEGVKINLNEIISSPVQPGTIQLTNGSQLVVLMKDAQTTGGYPRLLQLTEISINHLTQFPLNTPFRFQLID